MNLRRDTTIGRQCSLAALVIVTSGLVAGPATAEDVTDEQRPCVEMLEGWYGVDASKLERLLHANFVKQGVFANPKTGETVTPTMNKEEFIAAVAAERLEMPADQWAIEAETVDLSEFLATVKVTSVHLVDVCQLGKVDGEWQIINVLWTLRSS